MDGRLATTVELAAWRRRRQSRPMSHPCVFGLLLAAIWVTCGLSAQADALCDTLRVAVDAAPHAFSGSPKSLAGASGVDPPFGQCYISSGGLAANKRPIYYCDISNVTWTEQAQLRTAWIKRAAECFDLDPDEVVSQTTYVSSFVVNRTEVEIYGAFPPDGGSGGALRLKIVPL